ncbi:MAG: hypothetical protein ACD_19C00176G0030 [uncultured bacterium]|nr:MAG: hypothetical protein ACD_19C00176G0030 [uncultured bacterium]
MIELQVTQRVDVAEKQKILKELEFIQIQGRVAQLGTEHPLKCTLEGRRWNETPVRHIEVPSFNLCKFKVTNSFYEIINPKHRRPPQSLEGNMPVVDIMYGEALTFCKKLNELTNMNFRLPTEPEWVIAAAPIGWEFPYQERSKEPRLDWGHVYGDGNEHGVARVGDSRWGLNQFGLDQMGHNVSEFTFGHYRTSSGNWGAKDDGMYCIVKGGNYGHCSYTAGVNRRIIVDVSDRNPRIGLRLAHDLIK